MKPTILRFAFIFSLIFYAGTDNLQAQITARDAGGCLLSGDVWFPAGTASGYNTYETFLTSSFIYVRVRWSTTSNRWEIVADLNGDGIFNDILHYNTAHTKPNPPTLGTGTWTATPFGCGTLNQFSGPYTSTTVLPVSLIKFNAKLEGNLTKLEWTTASEQNNRHFIVQASINGSEWTDLGTVASKAENGSSSTPITYTFTHSLANLALAGFGLLGILMLPAIRNRFAKLAILLLTCTVIISCAKDQNDISLIDKKLKSGESVYFRLAQSDIDGKITLSEVVTVK